ncbi:MAG: 50S ribosomal protein L15e [Thermocladium sp.]|jgi:large subunit ribosomal protein L15e
MAKSLYYYIGDQWRRARNSVIWGVVRQRMLTWRREPTVTRIDKPTRLDKARKYGYRARPGIVIARVKVSRGTMNKERPSSGRRPKRMGVYGYTTYRSAQLIAEARAARKFPNMEVLGSYWVGEDGIYRYFEVVLALRESTSIAINKRRLLDRRARLLNKLKQ